MEADILQAVGHALLLMLEPYRLMFLFAGVCMGLALGILPGIGAWIANLAATAVSARLSRQDEFEADAFASALMVKAGLGTAPQKSLFRKLDALAGGRGTAPAWLLSHPRTDKRIAAIEALERRWGIA